MTSEETLKKHSQLISDLLDSKLRQAELDQVYDRIVDMYYEEIKAFLKEVKKTPASSRNIRHTKKPYWTEELSAMWKQHHDCEKVYLATPIIGEEG